MSAARPDIFISYAREDLEWVRPLAAELEARGWRVFWDRRIPAGKDWRSHIGTALEAARSVVVVWSEQAISSPFVLEEADEGKARQVLVPILRERVRIPLGFRHVHAADLTGWRPGQPSPEFETFIADLSELLAPSADADPASIPPEVETPVVAPQPISPISAAPPPDNNVETAREQAPVDLVTEGEIAAATSDELDQSAEVVATVPLDQLLLTSADSAEVVRPRERAIFDEPAAGELPPADASPEPASAVNDISSYADLLQVNAGRVAPALGEHGPEYAAILPSKLIALPPALDVDWPVASPASRRRLRRVAVTAILVVAVTVGGGIFAFRQQLSALLPAPALPAPDGSRLERNVSQAAEPLSDHDLWNSIRSSRDPADFATYLGKYPNGSHTAEARDQIFKLQPRSSPSKRTGDDGRGSQNISEHEFWNSINTSNNAADFAAYLKKYPNGIYAMRARDRVYELRVRPTTSVQTDEQPLAPAAPEPSLAAPKSRLSVPALMAKRIRDTERIAGQTFTDTLQDGTPCPFCPEMVVIPAGSFTMGSPGDEAERFSDEGPQRRVSFAKSFAMGRYEVTFDQWDACVAAGGCDGYRPDDRGWGRGSRPVINVSWNDAQEFVSWLSQQSAESYRLPTEAEWEYAARGRTRLPFWTGATISTTQANYNGNDIYGSGVKGEYRERTVAEDEAIFPANPFGLFHVHGNVWEWGLDCYVSSYDGAASDGQVAVARGDCPERVVRSGAWDNHPRTLRSAVRFRLATEARMDNLGFRVARMLTP